MTLITPVADYTIGNQLVKRNFRHRTEEGKMHYIESEVTQCETSPVYESSHIALEHPSGKWWESIFIPTAASGNEGFSITTWGKKHGADGSCQTKIVNCHEWYAQVATKIAASKGYFPLSFIGRKDGLTTAQMSPFRGAMKDEFVLGPAGLTAEQAKEAMQRQPSKAYEMLAAVSMTGMMQLVPVLEFFRKMKLNHHDLAGHISSINPALPDHARSMAFGVQITVNTILDNEDMQIQYAVKPKEPEVDRSTIYNEWGNFA